MRFPCVLGCALLLAACPPAPRPDGGLPDGGEEDAGTDAGADAGRPRVDAGAPDAGFTHAAVEDWCALQALAVCQRDLRCLRIVPGELAACLARRADGCDQLAYTRAVREGRLQFLEAAALACLNKNGQGSCAEAPADCEDVFVGLVAPGGGCVLEVECDPTAGFCYPYDGQCPHRCRAWTSLGGACDSFTTRCGPTAACEQDGGVNVCQPVRTPGASCVSYDGCGEDMICTDGQCVHRSAGLGETCGEVNGYPYCRSEFFCRQNLGVTPVPPGTCQLRAGLGGACSGNTDCLPNLRCSTVLTTGTCIEKAGPDAGCASYDDCRDGYFCSARSERCQALPTDAGNCSSTGSFYRCATGYFCLYDPAGVDDRCELRRAVDEPCIYDGQCLSNDCEYGTLPDGGFGGRCIPPCSVRADGGL